MEELTRLFTNVYARYDVLKNQLVRAGVPQEVFSVTTQFENHLAELKSFVEGAIVKTEPAIAEEATQAEATVNEVAQTVEEHTEPSTEANLETTNNGQES